MSDLILSTIPSTLTLTAGGQDLVLSVAAGSGEANTAANVGGGDAEVFRDKVGALLNFRTISGTGGIVVAENGDVIEISGGTGEVNLGANVGVGANVFRDKIGVTLNFRALVGLAGTTVVVNGDVVEITAAAGGETNLAANVGAGAGVFRDKTGVTLNLRTLVGLAGTTVVVNGDVIEITAGGTGDVVGPAVATDNAVARFDLTTGKLIQDSSVTIDDAGIIKAVATGATTHQLGNIQFGGTGSSINKIKVLTGAELVLASGGPFTVTSDETDSATAVNFILDGVQEMTTSGSLLLSVRNKTAGEQFFITNVGGVTMQGLFSAASVGGSHRIGTMSISEDMISVIGGGQLIMKNNNTWDTLSDALDVVGSVGFVLKTKRTLTAADAMLLEVKNLLAIKFSVDKDGDTLIAGDLNHDGTLVGLYGTAPAAQSAAYTRNATVVEDRTLLASASATTINNNNVLAALISDMQSRGFIG